MNIRLLLLLWPGRKKIKPDPKPPKSLKTKLKASGKWFQNEAP